MAGVLQHLRQTSRQLVAAPVFSVFSIVTLALGIGTATATFSFIHVIVGAPPGVPEVDRVVEVYHFPQGSGPMTNMAWEDYQDLRQRQTVFESVTAWSWFRAPIVGGGTSLASIGEIVDGDYFRTIRVPLQLGRPLQMGDDRSDAVPATVISFALWNRMFASAPDVIGKTLKAGGTTFEIVGVAAPEFTGLFNGGLLATSLWVPLNVARVAFPDRQEDFAPNSRNHHWLSVRARLAEGQTAATADRQIAAIGKQLDTMYPIGQDLPRQFRAPYAISRPWGVRLMSSRMLGIPDQILRPFVWGVLGSVALVLLVACTNLANLMVARHGARRAATAVRAALGASRRRLVFEAMLEPLALAIAGCVGGLIVARVLMVLFSAEISVGNAGVFRALPTLDLASFAVALGATALTLLVAGVFPAFQAARGGMMAVLSNTSGGSAPRWRGRRYLIASQVTVSVLLVAIATLFAGHLRRQSQFDTGIDLERLALAQVNFGAQRYEPGRARQIADAALAQTIARPDIEAAAVSSGLPFGLNAAAGAFLRSPAGASTTTYVGFVAGTDGLFDALGVEVTRGRKLDRRDTATATPVIVLSAKAAAAAFGTGDPIGRQVVFERRRAVGEVAQPPKTLTVVGIAEEAELPSAPAGHQGAAYLPLDQHYEGDLVLVARTAGDPAALAGDIRATFTSIDSELVVHQSGTGLALAGPDTTFPRLMVGMATSLGTMALVLALGGLYGVLSYVVAGRTREIGIRIALGAGASRIQRQIILEGLSPVVIGLVSGLGFGLIARASMQPLFLRLVPSVDATLLFLIPALFVGAGIGACYLPARRASRVDPNVALRNR